MDTRTGEILNPETMQRKQEAWDRECGIKNARPKESWFFVSCAVEPTSSQISHGVKGWHLCLCGSGKKFRECCRVKTPYVKRKPRPQTGGGA